MKKEIIIDGVNVAGCEFAVKPINDNRIKCHCAKGLLQIAKMQEQPESIKSGLCENNTNCYYKQLQRLKQENEKLNTTIYILQSKITTMCEHNKELWQKNEELKASIKHQCYKCRVGDTTEDKLRSALEEIKTLCNKDAGIYTNAKVVGLINEVLNEQNN